MNRAYITGKLLGHSLRKTVVSERYKTLSKRGLRLGLGVTVASTVVRFAASGVIINEDNLTRPEKPVDVTEPASLSHTFLVQQACAVAVDSSTRVLTQTLLILETAYEQYKGTLKKATYIMELSKKLDQGGIEGIPAVEDALIQLRSNLKSEAAALYDANLLYEYAARSLSAAADTAFMSGLERISLLATERLNSSNREVAHLKTEITALEKSYLLAQEEYIKNSSE